MIYDKVLNTSYKSILNDDNSLDETIESIRNSFHDNDANNETKLIIETNRQDVHNVTTQTLKNNQDSIKIANDISSLLPSQKSFTNTNNLSTQISPPPRPLCSLSFNKNNKLNNTSNIILSNDQSKLKECPYIRQFFEYENNIDINSLKTRTTDAIFKLKKLNAALKENKINNEKTIDCLNESLKKLQNGTFLYACNQYLFHFFKIFYREK